MKLSRDELESFIDERLETMSLRPGMWGSPDSLEGQCRLLLELYYNYCINPSVDFDAMADFQRMARQLHPRRPGPMMLSQWFTDKQYGCKEALEHKGEPWELQRWASEQLVRFFIAWKDDLKNRFDFFCFPCDAQRAELCFCGGEDVQEDENF